MNFEFATAGRIVFGPGSLQKEIAGFSAFGRNPLVVTGKTPDRFRPFFDRLRDTGSTVTLFPVSGEPTTTEVSDGVHLARQSGCDLVIGIGGGSVIDAGKAIAALIRNPGELMDYLEVIGKGLPLQQPPVDYIAVPTTAGTGAEVTRNAVLTSVSRGVKVSLRSLLMLPRLAVVDPELTLSLPPDVTAATGLDALTQLIEAFVSKKATPVTDAVCREGLIHAARSLYTAYRDGQNLAARTDMSLAALFSGLALANGGLGAVHGIAAPLGGLLSIPHGLVCGQLLLPVIRANVRQLESLSGQEETLLRFEETARLLTGDPGATIADGMAWLSDLIRRLHLPPLADFGLKAADFPRIAEAAARAGSMKGNPVPLSREALVRILEETP